MGREPFFGKIDGHPPSIAADAFIAPMATVIGRVRIGAKSSVWYGCVLRADGEEEVVIGDGCNIQDLSLMHADPGFPAVLGDRVSVGHRAIVHGARVEDDALVGMGATILNGAKVGSGSVVAAGAVVTPGTEIPQNSLAAGVPAKVVREARDSDKEMISHTHESYLRKSEVHGSVEAVGRFAPGSGEVGSREKPMGGEVSAAEAPHRVRRESVESEGGGVETKRVENTPTPHSPLPGSDSDPSEARER